MSDCIDKSWTYSRYKRCQNISTFRYFRLERQVVAGCDVVALRTKQTYVDMWSRVSWQVKNQACVGEDRGGTLQEIRRPDLREYQTIQKKCTADVLERVRKSLEHCRGRVTAGEYQRLQLDLEELGTTTHAPFHWANSGRYDTERLAKAPKAPDDLGEEESDDDCIPVEPPVGLFPHYVQVLGHRLNPEPSSLLVGNMVVVDADAVGQLESSRYPPPRAGFLMAKILRVSRRQNTIQVRWYKGVGVKDLEKWERCTWRPFVLPEGDECTIGADDVMMTFRVLSDGGRMLQPIRNALQYKLSVHSGEVEHDPARSAALGSAELAEAMDARSLERYREDDDDADGVPARRRSRGPGPGGRRRHDDESLPASASSLDAGSSSPASSSSSPLLPIACPRPGCNKRFKKKSGMKAHLTTMHSESSAPGGRKRGLRRGGGDESEEMTDPGEEVCGSTENDMKKWKYEQMLQQHRANPGRDSSWATAWDAAGAWALKLHVQRQRRM